MVKKASFLANVLRRHPDLPQAAQRHGLIALRKALAGFIQHQGVMMVIRRRITQ